MTRSIETLKLGGKAAILATLMATASFAQTAPAGVTTLDEVEFPTLQSVETDQQVIDDLSAQGYENVVVTRADDTLIVTGERGGLPTEMIFSAADGALVSVDGVVPGEATADAATPPVTNTVAGEPEDVAATDGEEPASDVPDASNFSGQDQQPLDTPTASIEGDDTDPVAETIPTDAATPAPEMGEAGQEADGGAETDGEDG